MRNVIRFGHSYAFLTALLLMVVVGLQGCATTIDGEEFTTNNQIGSGESGGGDDNQDNDDDNSQSGGQTASSSYGENCLETPPVPLNSIAVSDLGDLQTELNSAQPGDQIEIQPGTYSISNDKIRITRSGTTANPIHIKAASPGSVEIIADYNVQSIYELFWITGNNIIVENLKLTGGCNSSNHPKCAHAFHIAGGSNILIQENEMVNFDAQIKANGNGGVFPDNVRVIRNRMYNTSVRQTSAPVTPIDVVGGHHWKVCGNAIRDFGKAQGNGITYAAFFKGNSQHGIFEENLIICEDNVPMIGAELARVGLSFGGGGSAPASICDPRDFQPGCPNEHSHGIMRNNIIKNCNDVGVYAYRAPDSKIYNNTIINTAGLDHRGSVTYSHTENNLLGGDIEDRDGATHTGTNNIEFVAPAQFLNWFPRHPQGDYRLSTVAGMTFPFIDSGDDVAVTLDVCGATRVNPPDVGAVDYAKASESEACLSTMTP